MLSIRLTIYLNIAKIMCNLKWSEQFRNKMYEIPQSFCGIFYSILWRFCFNPGLPLTFFRKPRRKIEHELIDKVITQVLAIWWCKLIRPVSMGGVMTLNYVTHQYFLWHGRVIMKREKIGVASPWYPSGTVTKLMTPHETCTGDVIVSSMTHLAIHHAEIKCCTL